MLRCKHSPNIFNRDLSDVFFKTEEALFNKSYRLCIYTSGVAGRFMKKKFKNLRTSSSVEHERIQDMTHD